MGRVVDDFLADTKDFGLIGRDGFFREDFGYGIEWLLILGVWSG